MSFRVTRSSARLAADNTAATLTAAPTPTPAQPTSKSRKRKAATHREPSPEELPEITKAPSTRRTKRQKVVAPEPSPPTTPRSRQRAGNQPATMAKPGYEWEPPFFHNACSYQSSSSSNIPVDKDNPPLASDTSRRKSSRGKKNAQGLYLLSSSFGATLMHN